MPRIFAVLLGTIIMAAPLTAAPPTLFDPIDFVEYWSAARVHISGGNPYDGEQILPLQQLASGKPDKTTPTMLWTPPWTLPLYWPIAALPPREAHLLWLTLQLACVIAAGVMTWQAVEPLRSKWSWLAPAALALFFGPTFWLLEFGQNTGFLVLGLAGFLLCKQSGYHLGAGIFAALTAVKPHLLALFGWALLLDAVASGTGRRSLFAGVSTLTLLGLVTLIPDPAVYQQFITAITSPTKGEVISVSDWQLPLLSYGLRCLVDPVNRKAMSVGFIPLMIGVIVLTLMWWKVRRSWCWLTALPWLVGASAFLAPYGGWLFDLIVLLVPMTIALHRLRDNWRYAFALGKACGPLLIWFANLQMKGLEDGWWITPYLMGLAGLVYWKMRWDNSTP